MHVVLLRNLVFYYDSKTNIIVELLETLDNTYIHSQDIKLVY